MHARSNSPHSNATLDLHRYRPVAWCAPAYRAARPPAAATAATAAGTFPAESTANDAEVTQLGAWRSKPAKRTRSGFGDGRRDDEGKGDGKEHRKHAERRCGSAKGGHGDSLVGDLCSACAQWTVTVCVHLRLAIDESVQFTTVLLDLVLDLGHPREQWPRDGVDWNAASRLSGLEWPLHYAATPFFNHSDNSKPAFLAVARGSIGHDS